uniref:Solute carrier family 40 protein n=1 Tax=Panagrellus redivivus TaxID=6233 RepID=A0A7E4VW96_PANRE
MAPNPDFALVRNRLTPMFLGQHELLVCPNPPGIDAVVTIAILNLFSIAAALFVSNVITRMLPFHEGYQRVCLEAVKAALIGFLSIINDTLCDEFAIFGLFIGTLFVELITAQIHPDVSGDPLSTLCEWLQSHLRGQTGVVVGLAQIAATMLASAVAYSISVSLPTIPGIPSLPCDSQQFNEFHSFVISEVANQIIVGLLEPLEFRGKTFVMSLTSASMAVVRKLITGVAGLSFADLITNWLVCPKGYNFLLYAVSLLFVVLFRVRFLNLFLSPPMASSIKKAQAASQTR